MCTTKQMEMKDIDPILEPLDFMAYIRKGTWVSIQDDLPNVNQVVIATSLDGNYGEFPAITGKYTFADIDHWYKVGTNELESKITHWLYEPQA